MADVPLNAYRHEGFASHEGSRDSVVRGNDETLPHVLNFHCRPFLPPITRRHNAIVERIKKAASGMWKIVSANQPVGRNRLRPDLMLQKCDDVLLLDVAFPFENGNVTFDVARLIKERKYAPLVAELSSRFRTVRFDAIIVGSLGSWDSANDR